MKSPTTEIDGLPVLEYLTTPPPTSWSKSLRTPIYQLDAYLDLRERHSRQEGIDFDREAYVAGIDWPTDTEATPQSPKRIKVPIDTTDPCKVYMKLTYRRDKTIKVELLSDLCDLHERYYAKGMAPPFGKILRAYRRHGYSKADLAECSRRHKINETSRKEYADKLISRVFPEKKPSAKKKEKVVVVKKQNNDIDSEIDEVASNEDSDDDSWENDDDHAFDMEMDEDTEENVDDGSGAEDELYVDDM